MFDADEFDGRALRTARDDFKPGLKHGGEFAKVAIYGNRGRQEVAAKVGSWFIPGEAKYFESYDEAVEWLQT